MNEALTELLQRLQLEPIEVNIFRAPSPHEGWQRVFGGQVLSQALAAASNTVDDDRIAHSLHCYFLRPGNLETPIIYDVDRIRDGRSFNTRRVVAIQNGQAIFNMAVSFQVAETGLNHQAEMPKVPGPLECPTGQELFEKQKADAPEGFNMPMRPRPIQMRYVDPVNEFKPEKMPAQQSVWFKTADPLPADTSIAVHQQILAYTSDMTLLDTALRPHGISWFNEKVQMASLDHAMWFHQPFRCDEWLLYTQDSPSSSGARGFNRGTIFTQSGDLVASCTQEGLMRVHD